MRGVKKIANRQRNVFVLAVALCLLACSKSQLLEIQVPSLSLDRWNSLWVTTTDYQTGLLVGVDLLHPNLKRTSFPVYSDAVVRTPESSPYFFVVNRLGADNIQWGERSQKKILGQYSVGRGSNPQDIAFVNSEVAYVSRLQNKFLLKVNPLTGKVLREIDLLEGADPETKNCTDSDGFPEMAWMKISGTELWVTLQRLNSEKGYEPSDKSQVAVLDMATDTVKKIVNLKGTNPVTDFRELEGKVTLGEAGKLGVFDGGIELFDGNLNSQGWVTTEAQLGGDIIDGALLNDQFGVAIVARNLYGEKPKTQLVAFSVKSGAVISVLKDPGTYSLHQILIDSNRNLFYVSDRSSEKPGIWVFHSGSLKPLTQYFYDVGLPPYHMVLAP
jgi:hypothetical protein